MKERYKIIPEVFLLLIQEGKVLLSRRFQTGYEDGNYGLPSGHKEIGEYPTEAVEREALEEIGVSVFKSSPNVDSPATRGAVIQTVLETLGVNIEKELDNPYKDVSKSNKFADAIFTATKLGIVAGDTKRDGSLAGSFRPNSAVNRAETAKIFSRLMDLGLVAQKE